VSAHSEVFRNLVLSDPFVLLLGFSCLSAVTILGHIASKHLRSNKSRFTGIDAPNTPTEDDGQTRSKGRFGGMVKFHGGASIVAFMVAHLAGSVALLCLSVLQAVSNPSCSQYGIMVTFVSVNTRVSMFLLTYFEY